MDGGAIKLEIKPPAYGLITHNATSEELSLLILKLRTKPGFGMTVAMATLSLLT